MFPTKKMNNGRGIPVLGLGTYEMKREDVSKSVAWAMEAGYRLYDTAQVYRNEKEVGEAVRESKGVERKDVFITTKVSTSNQGYDRAMESVRESLNVMGLDYLDLYLLHWPGNHPLAATVAGFESLRAQGLIRHWGVSNFDVDDMERLWALPTPRHRTVGCSVNQVYYSPSQRGIEFALAPLLAAHRVPVMAYSPTDQGKLALDPVLSTIGARHEASAVQVALAWILTQPHVIAIPKAVEERHLRENFAALTLRLDAADRRAIDAHFPPPEGPQPLAML